MTPRSVIALVLIVLGIAWIAYYYLVVRVDPTVIPPEEPGGPKFLADLGELELRHRLRRCSSSA